MFEIDLSPLDNFHWSGQKAQPSHIRAITKELEGLLSTHGFVKCRTTYLRRHGDGLLQYIAVASDRCFYQPCIYANVTPLYQCPVSITARWLSELRCVSGLGGTPIEQIARIPADIAPDSPFPFSSDFAAAIVAVRDVLQSCILPTLENIRQPEDVLRFRKIDPTAIPSFPHAALFLRMREYVLVSSCLTRELADLEQHGATVQRLFEEGAISSAALEYHRRFDEERRLFCQRMLTAIQRNDEDSILAELNAAMHAAYQELAKYTKAFVKKSPCSPLARS